MKKCHAFLPIVFSIIFCSFRIAAAQCAVPFSVATRDSLGNVDTGLNEDDLKWFQKISKHYPDLCYISLEPNKGTWLYIDITNQQDTVTASGNAVIDRYSTVYTLKIGQFRNDRLLVLRTFQRVQPASSGGSVRGMLNQLGSMKRGVLLDGMDWLENNLTQVDKP